MGRRPSGTEDASGLPEADVRAIVRLLADVAVMKGGHPAKKRTLMNGLAELVDADGWLWTMTRVNFDTNTPMSIGLMHEGLTDEQVTGWIEAGQRTTGPSPEDAPMGSILRHGRHFTRTRQQVVPDEAWYAHPSVQKHRIRTGIDHFLYSIYPLDEPGVFSGVGLFRRVGRDPFDPRHCRIAHILLSEVDWLHRAELPIDRGITVPRLTPRQRVVLVMLLEGRSLQEIAKLLHISPHTAKDHAKAIYRHFAVSSQVDLMRRFRHGDGGDLP